MKVKLESIQIPERFRVEYGDLAELSTSIDTYGLINPITITFVEAIPTLIAGARRLFACQQLGLEEIECTLFEDLSELGRKEIELEENLIRKDFTWQEEIKAKTELVELKRLLASGGIKHDPRPLGEIIPSDESIALTLGESPSKLSQDIQLAKGIIKYPELAKEEFKTTAWRKLKRLEDRNLRALMANCLAETSENVQLYCGDCRDIIKTIPSESIHLVITDPPWGISLDQQHSPLNEHFAECHPTKFDDNEADSLVLLEEVLPELYRVMVPDSHFYVFFATRLYIEVRDLLESHFSVSPIPLIWKKNIVDHLQTYKTFAPNYETFFFCRKGKRDLSEAYVESIFPFPTPSKRSHPTQKSQELIESLIELSSLPNESILDPFAGSGVVGIAAKKLNRKVILIEKDENYFNDIKVNLA